jgi:formate/nitrite transporter FocA (FNT family)
VTDGEYESPEAGEETERQIERKREDEQFVPVVVKRQDQTLRHPDDVLRTAIREGHEQSKRGVLSLFLSGVSAGAILGFAAMAVGVASSIALDRSAEPERFLLALVYPLGFVLCLMSGTQLFTEHTALAVYPVLDRCVPPTSLARVWTTVLAGNVAGCALGAVLLALAEGVVEGADGYAYVAEHLLGYTPFQTLMSAVLAGWLMALGGWLLMSTPHDVSRIIVIYVTTFLIGLGGLHHSIVGTSELLVAGMTGAAIGLSEAFVTIGLAVLGNLVGGALFVAVLNYGHIRQTQRVGR